MVKLRWCTDKHGDTVLPDRYIQLHDLSVGVSVGQNQKNNDATPVQEEAIYTAKLPTHISNKGHGNAIGCVHGVPVSKSAIVRIPSMDGIGRSK